MGYKFSFTRSKIGVKPDAERIASLPRDASNSLPAASRVDNRVSGNGINILMHYKAPQGELEMAV